MILDDNRDSAARRTFSATARLLSALKLDGPLLVGLGLLAIYALVVQYSASGQSLETILRTLMRVGIGTVAMIALAQSSPNFLRSLAPWLYGAACCCCWWSMPSVTSAKGRSAGSTSA